MVRLTLIDETISLDENALEEVIQKVNQLSDDLSTLNAKIGEELLKQGVPIAKKQLSKYGIGEGPLSNSIRSTGFNGAKGNGYIIAGEGLRAGGISGGAEGKKSSYPLMSYAIFVEQGSGGAKVKAEAQKASNPFAPKLKLSKNNATPSSSSDGKWVYFDEQNNEFVTTSGQPPKPFMHDTLYELWVKGIDIAAKLVRECLHWER